MNLHGVLLAELSHEATWTRARLCSAGQGASRAIHGSDATACACIRDRLAGSGGCGRGAEDPVPEMSPPRHSSLVFLKCQVGPMSCVPELSHLRYPQDDIGGRSPSDLLAWTRLSPVKDFTARRPRRSYLPAIDEEREMNRRLTRSIDTYDMALSAGVLVLVGGLFLWFELNMLPVLARGLPF